MAAPSLIQKLDDVWMIHTHPSSRNCRVNGEPVTTAVVEQGDRLQVGRFEMLFQEPDSK